jgi:hypothetical protein
MRANFFSIDFLENLPSDELDALNALCEEFSKFEKVVQVSQRVFNRAVRASSRVGVSCASRPQSNVAGPLQKNDGVGKVGAEMPSRRRVKSAKALRIGADFAQQPFHLAIKTHAEFRRSLRVITNRSGKFIVRFRVKREFHSPAILRARASDSSRGNALDFARFNLLNAPVNLGLPSGFDFWGAGV